MKIQSNEIIHIDWKPDKSSDLSLYKQIVNYFGSKIQRGEWESGQKIPSQRRLAELFEVNRSTIVEAMEELYSMGLLEGHTGSGTKIAYDLWSSLISLSTPDWKDYISKGLFKSNIDTIQCINQNEYDPAMIKLNSGEMAPDLLPVKTIKEVLARVSESSFPLAYSEPKGLLELREVLCDYLKRKGITATPEEILITSGTLQSLQLISVCIVPPRSTIYVESPSYLKSLRIFQSAGAKLEGVPMDGDGIMPWRIDVKRKNEMQTPSILYTIPTFQNPTGIVMTEERRQDLLKFCQAHRLPIVEDDVFSDLWFETPPPKPLKASDKNECVLYAGSCSKVYSPGLRIGWIVGPEPVIKRLADIKMQHDYGASSVSQIILAESLKNGYYDEYLPYIRQKLSEKRDHMLELLEKHFSDIATWEKPQGGFFIYLQLRHKVPMDKVFKQAFEENILLTPGYIYDFYEKSSIRLSYSYVSFEQMDKALPRLAEILSSHLSPKKTQPPEI